MKRIKTGLTGFILGDWLGMPYRGKGKGTFKQMFRKYFDVIMCFGQSL